MRVDDYPLLMKMIAEFSVSSLQAWNYAPNSVHYLFSLWQRMVASVPYVKASEPHLLETYAPEVTKAYITSRLDSVTAVLRYVQHYYTCCHGYDKDYRGGVVISWMLCTVEMDWRTQWKTRVWYSSSWNR